MNPLVEAARQAATDGWLMGVMTVVFVVFFVAYGMWAWWPSNAGHMDEMSRAALDDSPPGPRPDGLASGQASGLPAPIHRSDTTSA